MAFGKRSRISDNIYDFSFMICGESGIGKTTLVSEVCEKEFGEDGYLLLNTGDEDGVSAIDGVTYEDVPTYKKYVEICKDIINNKQSEYPNLKVIVVDTLDQLIKITETQAIENYNRENMGTKNFKKATTTNAIYGGFGASYDVVFNMIYDYVRKLIKVGVRTWFVCHSKTKDIVDPLSNASYTTLTSNMAQRYFNDFKTKAHLVGVACIDRTIEAESTGRKNIVTHKDITVNKVKDERRKIVFRDDSFSIDSKSRFVGIVNEIPLGSDEFIKAVKDAIKNSKSKSSHSNVNTTPSIVEEEIKLDEDVQFEEPMVEEEEEEVEDLLVEEDKEYPENLLDEIKVLFKNANADDKKTIRAIVSKYGKNRVSELDEEGLRETYDALTHNE